MPDQVKEDGVAVSGKYTVDIASDDLALIYQSHRAAWTQSSIGITPHGAATVMDGTAADSAKPGHNSSNG